MTTRIAAIAAFVAFAVCLLVGGIGTTNSFTTTVGRALLAMFCTYVVGWVVGWMAQKMLDEHLAQTGEKMRNDSTKPTAIDR